MFDNNLVIYQAFKKQRSGIVQALGLAGNLMTSTAKETLERNGSNVTSKAYQSIIHNLVETPEKIVLNFGNNARSKNDYPYAGVIEYGRKPGKMPPVSSILEWLQETTRIGKMKIAYFTPQKNKQRFSQGLEYVSKNTKSMSKFYQDQQVLNNASWGIAYKIKRDGIKEKPFMRPAFIAGIQKFKELVNK